MDNQSETVSAENLKVKMERMYVKEVNCKLPHAPNLFDSPEFKEQGQIEPHIEMQINAQPLSLNKFEVTLHAIINGKAKNLSFFNLDVQQARIFTIDVPQNQMEYIIKNCCVPILHPYLANLISNSIVQAGLPPVILQPFQPIIEDAKIGSNHSEISRIGAIENVTKPKEALVLNNFN